MTKTQTRTIAVLIIVQFFLFLGSIIASRHDRQVLNSQLKQLDDEIKNHKEQLDRLEKSMKKEQQANEQANKEQK